jgi:putative endonuclease
LKWLPKLKRPEKKLGASGEDLAAAHLRSQGFLILDRNFRCSLGELDLVARKGLIIVFAEVKTRRSEQRGAPETAVTYKKQQRIIKLAHVYLKQNNLYHLQPRFDVIAILWKENGKPEIKHIPAAFMARS